MMFLGSVSESGGFVVSAGGIPLRSKAEMHLQRFLQRSKSGMPSRAFPAGMGGGGEEELESRRK